MIGKYIVKEKTKIGPKKRLYILIDSNNKEFLCKTERDEDGKIQLNTDEDANIYDVAEALFQNDLEVYSLLPPALISPDMEIEYENYYPGKGYCIYKKQKEFDKVYEKEEERISSLDKTATTKIKRR